MIIPQLGDPTFQTDFTDFCRAMKQNIERLMSVQYTKGEPGNSVYSTQTHAGYTPVGTLTNLGAGILNAIFNTNFDNTTTIDEVNDIIAGSYTNIQVGNDYFTSGGVAPSIIVDGVIYTVIPDFMESTTGIDIDINLDEVTGVAYLSNPYIFIDNRIKGISQMIRDNADETELYKTFHDFSVAVYGKGICDTISHPEQDPHDPSTWIWEFEAVQVVPKIYFDQNINEFCWEVNGQQTGITAQGVKGDTGESSNMHLAIGTKTGSMIILDKIQAVDASGNLQWAVKDDAGIWYYIVGGERVEITQPKDGDLVLAFYAPETRISGDVYERAYLGRTYIGNLGPYTYIGFDDDGMCDVFESIRCHDCWNIMMNINSYTTGSPRGYILPADPSRANPSTTNPELMPQKVHMTYSEKNSADSEGFAKLHSSPIFRDGDPDPTQMSQTNNPPAHHIGDWQVDYNMSIQGAANVAGPLDVMNNVSVQGDVRVQGSIRSSSLTADGAEFPYMISGLNLACVSKFKDVNFKFERNEIKESSIWKLQYTTEITGILELNVGEITWFNRGIGDTDVNNRQKYLHNSLSGYGDNWTGGTGYSNDTANIMSFVRTYIPEYSKLYNVIRYDIPFKILRKITTPDLGYNGSAESSRNVFNMDGDLLLYMTGSGGLTTSKSWSDTIFPWSNNGIPGGYGYQYNDGRKISLRLGCEGFNTKIKPQSMPTQNPVKKYGYYIFGNGSYYNILKNKYIDSFRSDTDGEFMYDKPNDWSFIINISSSTVTHPWLYNYSSTNHGASKTNLENGSVKDLVENFQDNQVYPRQNDGYDIYGDIYYAPRDITLKYWFGIFTRIFENDMTEWSEPQNKTRYTDFETYCKSITYNINVNLVPVGCLSSGNAGPGQAYILPIWNGIYVRNVMPGTTPEAGISGTTSSTSLYPLISHSIRKKIESTEDASMNMGNYSYEVNDIESSYIYGLFDQPSTYNTLSKSEIKAKHTDITPTMRFVDDNIKLAPSNWKDGYSDITDASNAIEWKSFKEIYSSIIPYEGYIGATQITSSNAGKVKLGCGNIKWVNRDTDSKLKNTSVNGLLMYPHTPCIIKMKTDPNTNTPIPVGQVADVNEDSGDRIGHLICSARQLNAMDDGVYGPVFPKSMEANSEYTPSNSSSGGNSGGNTDPDPGGGDRPPILNG